MVVIADPGWRGSGSYPGHCPGILGADGTANSRRSGTPRAGHHGTTDAEPGFSRRSRPGTLPIALWPTPIRPAAPTATLALPTPIPSPTLPPGDFAIGVLVKVVGVGTSGLNIRSSPGYSGTPRFLAAEDEVFAIVDGPQTIDGLEWWRVEDPDDSQRFGWAARNYLMVIAPSE